MKLAVLYQGGEWLKAFRLFADMRREGLEPSLVHRSVYCEHSCG